MEEIKPVVEVPNAGEEQKPAEVTSEEVQTGQDETVLADALAVLSESEKALTAAETKIVSLKRKAKQERDGFEPDDIDSRIEEAVQRRMEELNLRKSEEDDQELKSIQLQKKALQDQRQKLAEISESLKAKHSIQTGGGESNQDKLKPAIDYSKALTADQKVLYQKIADGRNLSLDLVLKAKAEAELKGIPLIAYLKTIKN